MLKIKFCNVSSAISIGSPNGVQGETSLKCHLDNVINDFILLVCREHLLRICFYHNIKLKRNITYILVNFLLKFKKSLLDFISKQFREAS